MAKCKEATSAINMNKGDFAKLDRGLNLSVRTVGGFMLGQVAVPKTP